MHRTPFGIWNPLTSHLILRHRAELSFKQQLLSAQERADVESRRAMMLDDQVGS